MLGALASAIRPAMETGRCLVAFSGGRDSSVILAAAVQVARREGLPPPIPATFRFVDDACADESEWQEQVISHLRVEDWLRIEVTDELDLLGPHARAMLLRHGVQHPSNAYTMTPLLKRARGGALLTGTFGDQLFLGWRWQGAADVRAGRRPTFPTGWLRSAHAASPRPARAAIERARLVRTTVPDWLLPDARSAVIRRLVEARIGQPARWDEWVIDYNRSRAWELNSLSAEAIAGDHDAMLVRPFGDPAVRRAIAAAGGRDGFGDRTAAMRSLFAGLLPDAVLRRSTKAAFPLARGELAAFRWRWNGHGLPAGLVDPDRLRAAPACYLSSYLWQSLWLQTEGRASRG